MYYAIIGWEGVDWNYLAEDRDLSIVYYTVIGLEGMD
jgi:hypothetical protein